MSSTEGTTPWVKASASGGTGNCVEMRRQGDVIEVRDSKHPAGPVLSFTTAAFRQWLAGAARDEYLPLL
jgi:Domain of unknown function (DUF397)